MDNSTQQGLAALKAGNKSLARTLFRKAIQQNHDDTQAWLGLSAAVESDFEKAIQLGYVKLCDEIRSQYLEEYGE